MALIHSMRLSLMKGAHADLSGTAWQEIGVKPHFGLSGIMVVDLPLPVRYTARPKNKEFDTFTCLVRHGSSDTLVNSVARHATGSPLRASDDTSGALA